MPISIIDQVERETRQRGMELVDQLIERFGLETIHTWLWMHAVARGQDLRCLRGDR